MATYFGVSCYGIVLLVELLVILSIQSQSQPSVNYFLQENEGQLTVDAKPHAELNRFAASR